MIALNKAQGKKTIITHGHALKGRTITALGTTQEKNNHNPRTRPERAGYKSPGYNPGKKNNSKQ
jgi:acetylornithine/succinyldiaminopimelate/putrescine aminotransferase